MEKGRLIIRDSKRFRHFSKDDVELIEHSSTVLTTVYAYKDTALHGSWLETK
ncbi:hypothetical protein YC2023_053674 [Brassica napus]